MDDFASLEFLKEVEKPITLILTNGFEDRVSIAAHRMVEMGLTVREVVLIVYEGDEHQETYLNLMRYEDKLSPGRPFKQIEAEPQRVSELIQKLDPQEDVIACDISGFSRHLILSVLTLIHRCGFEILIIYTEAKHYYPLKRDFAPFLKEPDTDTAFMKLIEYEDSETVHSSSCNVEEVSELRGEMIPSYPTMLVAFLSFKRSRLSSILNRYETNFRVLIGSNPVRKDLKWRKRALEIINFDLIADNNLLLEQVPTLYWRSTFDFLEELYKRDHNGYRFNVLLAPLGGKMQTVGAWYFAIQYPDVKVVTSTPVKLFPGKYSRGYLNSYVTTVPRLKDRSVAQ
jgi:hypothetical protein